MVVKFVLFLAVSMVTLLVLGGGDEPRVVKEKTASPDERVRTADDSILDGLYQLEG